MDHVRYSEKNIVIRRDENGFGISIGSQNPVVVMNVAETGAAYKAGVRQYDRIIKVNGTLVKFADQASIARMIQECKDHVNIHLQSIVSKSSSTSQDTQSPQQQQATSTNLLSAISNLESNLDTNDQDTATNTQHDDHPYYYYKPTPKTFDSSSTTGGQASSATLEPLAQAPRQNKTYSIARSRSASKFSVNQSSTTNHKFKSKTLRTRLVDDMKALTISSNQIISSSLSSSSSGSDLSDCDDLIEPCYSNTKIQECDIRKSTSSSDLMYANALNTNNNSSSIQIQSYPSNDSLNIKLTTKRMEIIKELIDTERTHTEKLKKLHELLYKPIKQEGLVPVEQLRLVFSCHKTLLKVHREILKLLISAQASISTETNEPLIGEALIQIFEGDLGQRLERAACTFCACQATNTEVLNRFTRKDSKVGEFLTHIANAKMLGRLGIKDLLASCFQRLTKYPLLLDNLYKALPSLKEFDYERLCITRALHQTRQILTHVNDAVTKAISHQKLQDIWKKTERHSGVKQINIETQQLLHEGPLTLRLAKRSYDVYVLLLTQYLVVLTKESQDKYKLKNFILEGAQKPNTFSPIFDINEHLVTRCTATDENGFYLLCKENAIHQARIYEFASQSPAERNLWKEKIHAAQMYNYANVVEDEDALTRYSELISLC